MDQCRLKREHENIIPNPVVLFAVELYNNVRPAPEDSPAELEMVRSCRPQIPHPGSASECLAGARIEISFPIPADKPGKRFYAYILASTGVRLPKPGWTIKKKCDERRVDSPTESMSVQRWCRNCLLSLLAPRERVRTCAGVRQLALPGRGYASDQPSGM